MYQLFYKPQDGVTGDFIPFWDKGEFRLFYLKDYRNQEVYGEGTPWFQIGTRDFVSFTEYGEAIPRGKKEEQDLYIFTGSVIKAQGQYHIFYTGHNGHLAEQDKPMQAVMHAVSEDLLHWEKRYADTFYADESCYEKHDFRDPFVYYDEARGLYAMLLVVRKKGGGYHAGLTERYVSQDLRNWTDDGVCYAPGLYINHECPDLFRMGDWWYLVFSEYSDKTVTRYVMSRSPEGPWVIPQDDSFDGRAYYAAKTASDGEKRCLFGWIPTKFGEDDGSGWMWGGNLAVHELVQRADGTLGCRMPKSVADAFSVTQAQAEAVTAASPYGKGETMLFSNTQGACHVNLSIAYTPETRRFGINFGQTFGENNGYKFSFSLAENALRFDSDHGCIQTQHVTRPVALQGNAELELDLLLDDDICVLYVNREIALSARMYIQNGGDISLFAVGGQAQACGSLRHMPQGE